MRYNLLTIQTQLSKNLAKPRGVYVCCTGSRTCEGVHFFDVAKERGSWRQGRSRKGPPAALEKLPSMLLKRWVLLLDQCAALASQFLTRMDPRPWPGARLWRNFPRCC